MRFFLILFTLLLPLAAQETRSVHAILQQRLLELERERDRSERAFLELQAETRPVIDALTEEKALLETRLQAVQQESLLLNSAQATANRAAEHADKELTAVRGELNRIQTELQTQQQDFADTLNALQRAQQDLRARHQQEQTGTAERETELKGKLADLQERIAESEQAAITLQADKEALEREALDIQGLNRQLQNDLQEAQRRESLANAQRMALESRVDQLERSLQEAEEQRSRAELERDQLAMQVQGLELELNELRESTVPLAQWEQMQQELNEVLSHNRDLQSLLEKELARPDFAEPLARAERERDLLDAKLKTYETRLRDAENQTRGERARRLHVSEANRSLIKHIADLEAVLNDLQAQGREPAALQESARRDMSILANHIQSLRNELQQQRERQNASEAQRQILLNRIRELENGSAQP